MKERSFAVSEPKGTKPFVFIKHFKDFIFGLPVCVSYMCLMLLLVGD